MKFAAWVLYMTKKTGRAKPAAKTEIKNTVAIDPFAAVAEDTPIVPEPKAVRPSKPRKRPAASKTAKPKAMATAGKV